MKQRLVLTVAIIAALATGCGSSGSNGSAASSPATRHHHHHRPAPASGLPEFSTPTGNIRCAWDPPQRLRCDIGSGLQPKPSTPCQQNGETDSGYSGLRITSTVAEPNCASDAIAPGPALAYGKIWRHEGITCLSQQTGLICVDLAGHGFFLSRERWATF